MSLLLVTDDASREDVAETLRLLALDAKRTPNVVRKSELLDAPTKWDRAHACINDALDMWEACQ